MDWLIGDWAQLGETAAKAGVIYLVALVGLRLGERRTLAQWTIIDFAMAVAVGAIVGRTSVASGQSVATGAAALLTLVAVHRLASLLRFNPLLGKLADHRVRVLLVDGRVRRRQLRLCGLTDNDLHSQLRQRGIFELSGLRYVLYEAKGSLTVVPEVAGDDPELVRDGLDSATGWAPGRPDGASSRPGESPRADG